MIKLNLDNTPAILKKYREGKRMSQKDVAEGLGISQAAYANYENGKSIMNLDMLQRAVAILNIPMIDIATGAMTDEEIVENSQRVISELSNRLKLYDR